MRLARRRTSRSRARRAQLRSRTDRSRPSDRLRSILPPSRLGWRPHSPCSRRRRRARPRRSKARLADRSLSRWTRTRRLQTAGAPGRATVRATTAAVRSRHSAPPRSWRGPLAFGERSRAPQSRRAQFERREYGVGRIDRGAARWSGASGLFSRGFCNRLFHRPITQARRREGYGGQQRLIGLAETGSLDAFQCFDARVVIGRDDLCGRLEELGSLVVSPDRSVPQGLARGGARDLGIAVQSLCAGDRQQKTPTYFGRHRGEQGSEFVQVGDVVGQAVANRRRGQTLDEVLGVDRVAEACYILPREKYDAIARTLVAQKQNFAPQRGLLDQAPGRHQTREVEQGNRSLGILAGLQDGLHERQLTGELQARPRRIDVAEQRQGLGLFSQDVVLRPAHERLFLRRNVALLEELRNDARRSA